MEIDVKKLLEKALEEERLIAALSYAGPAFLFVRVKGKASEFAVYHANQGCLLFAVRLLSKLIKKLPVVGKPAAAVCRIGLDAMAALGVKNALSGDMKPLPYIGELDISIEKEKEA